MTTRKSRKLAASQAETQHRAKSKSHAPPAAKTSSKAAAIIALLRREGGATLEQVMDATGWQKHSVRGFMAGTLKRRHGLTASSFKSNQGRTYCVSGEAQS